MSDFTPEAIAQLATRLYNERARGERSFPKTEAAMPGRSRAEPRTDWLPRFQPARSCRHAVPPTSPPVSIEAVPTVCGPFYRRASGLAITESRYGFSPRSGSAATRGTAPCERRLFAVATGARPLDVPAIRRDFPALNQRVHGKPLAGSTTRPPRRSRSA